MFNLLDSARRTGYESRFVWIGSDAWVTSGHREPRGSQHSPDDEHLEESVLEGALAIQPLVQKLIGFDEYFKSLTLDHEKENPWFREYWREYFKCGRKQRGKEVLAHVSKSANEESEDYCMTSNKNLSHGGYKQQRYLHFVRDAVYSVAHALHDLQVYLCGAGKSGVCDRMKHIDGETLHGYLHNVSFNDEGGRLFKFLDGRDGPLRYSILNFQKDLNGSYKWNVVGNYTQSENGLPMLKIDQKAITYRRNESGIFPKSTCTQSCEVHQIKVRETDDTCCWQCRSCGEFQRKSNDHKCSECPPGTRPNPDHSVCADIPEEFIDFHDPWAIGAMAVASLGLCTAYAIKTRKCPGGFNETRHIAFTNYTTIIIWLAFVPLYLASTSNSIRIVTLAISLSLGGLVQLGCLFFPKLYIVLFKPEKNTKEVVMSQHRSTVYLSTPSNLTPVVVVNGGTHYVQSAGVMNVDATEVAKKSRRNTGSGIWKPEIGRLFLSVRWQCRSDGVRSSDLFETSLLSSSWRYASARLGIDGHDTSTRSPLGKSWPKPRETEATPKAQFLTFSSDVGDHKRRVQLLLSRARRTKPSLKEVMTTTKTSPDLVQGGHTKDDAFAEDAPKSQIRTM
uniref:G-protein coupled receptors family 3 profile domain-containing protein n=1 Tax=Timema poppense TaxID=170557 RepID=A0A7R9H8A0_TIMPO|nr:unnamed protein product [Timema poppensis]